MTDAFLIQSVLPAFTARRQRAVRSAVAVALAVVTACSARSQVVNVWPGVAPGSESWTQTERTVEDTPLGTVAFNVVTPTLTAYLPDPARATGTGVLIAPGGYCVALTLDLEGTGVARWLQERGIAAFVLKYRLMEKVGDGVPEGIDMDAACGPGIADGVQALQVVRAHATEWGVLPDRVGLLGFSAGAMVTAGVLTNPAAEARPSFAAMIYGGPFGGMPTLPADLPPVFLAWAQDDAVALGPTVRWAEALASAGHRPEVHVFSSGGHGFGLKTQGTTSDHWIEVLYDWLEAQGLTRPPGTPHPAVQDTLPGAASRPAPLTIGETFAIRSEALGETRRINVYAPAGYAESDSLRLPVLYMPDGGTAEDFIHVAGLVQILSINGGMRPHPPGRNREHRAPPRPHRPDRGRERPRDRPARRRVRRVPGLPPRRVEAGHRLPVPDDRRDGHRRRVAGRAVRLRDARAGARPVRHVRRHRPEPVVEQPPPGRERRGPTRAPPGTARKPCTSRRAVRGDPRWPKGSPGRFAQRGRRGFWSTT